MTEDSFVSSFPDFPGLKSKEVARALSLLGRTATPDFVSRRLRIEALLNHPEENVSAPMHQAVPADCAAAASIRPGPDPLAVQLQSIITNLEMALLPCCRYERAPGAPNAAPAGYDNTEITEAAHARSQCLLDTLISSAKEAWKPRNRQDIIEALDILAEAVKNAEQWRATLRENLAPPKIAEMKDAIYSLPFGGPLNGQAR